MQKLQLAPTTMAIALPLFEQDTHALFLDFVRMSINLAVEGDIRLVPAYAPPPQLIKPELGYAMLSVKECAAAALSQTPSARCALAYCMWDPEEMGLKTRFAVALIIDQFGNIYGGTYPDPNIYARTCRKVAVQRYMSAGAMRNQSTSPIGRLKTITQSDIESLGDNFDRLPMAVAIIASIRSLADPETPDRGEHNRAT